ncbi:MAG: hypothetical protein HDT22_06100 [Ruminococcus sp.]|nr:hypothetical protein [Ruminococcus sp.]
MTLIITMISAIICTAIWYKNASNDKLKISTLCFMYWGAALMWLVDMIFEYIELQEEFFVVFMQNILNDSLLGISVIAFGLVAWRILLFIHNQKNILKNKN